MKLTQTQLAAIQKLKLARQTELKRAVEIDAQHAVQMDANKNEVRALVAAARELGVPDRQIYMEGLNMRDYRTLERYMVRGSAHPMAESAPEGVQMPVELPAVSGEVTIIEHNGQHWEVIDEDGSVFSEIKLYNQDGGYWLVTPEFEVEPPARIRDAMVAYAPRKTFIVFVGDEQILWNEEARPHYKAMMAAREREATEQGQ